MRHRHFSGVGRGPGTFQHVAAELNPAGIAYLQPPDAPAGATCYGTVSQPCHNVTLAAPRQLMISSRAPLRRQEILARWREGERPPRADSLWRSLTRDCGLGILVRSGARNKAEAFRHRMAQRHPAA